MGWFLRGQVRFGLSFEMLMTSGYNDILSSPPYSFFSIAQCVVAHTHLQSCDGTSIHIGHLMHTDVIRSEKNSDYE